MGSWGPETGCVWGKKKHTAVTCQTRHISGTSERLKVRVYKREVGGELRRPVQRVLTSGLMTSELRRLTSYDGASSSALCPRERWPVATALLREVSVCEWERDGVI